MARTYARLIANKRITINSVPETHKAEVIEILKKEWGVDAEGNPVTA